MFTCYCMVCGSLGELTKLRAYGFQFWFQVLLVAKGRAWDDCSAYTIFNSLGCLDCDIFSYDFDIVFDTMF